MARLTIMKLTPAAVVAAVAFTIAGCSAASSTATVTATPPATTTAAPAATPTTAAPSASPATSAASPTAATTPAPPATTAPAQAARGITVAPAGTAAPGPEQITLVSCGKGKLTYTFKNESPTPGAPKLDVNFLDGTAVVASNVSADATPVGTGQSGSGEVDALDQSGNPVTFNGCEVMGYALVNEGSVDPEMYAG